MSKKKLYLFALIMWILCTCIWCAHIFVDIYYGIDNEGLVVMHVITTLASLIAAVAAYFKYKNCKD